MNSNNDSGLGGGTWFDDEEDEQLRQPLDPDVAYDYSELNEQQQQQQQAWMEGGSTGMNAASDATQPSFNQHSAAQWDGNETHTAAATDHPALYAAAAATSTPIAPAAPPPSLLPHASLDADVVTVQSQPQPSQYVEQYGYDQQAAYAQPPYASAAGFSDPSGAASSSSSAPSSSSWDYSSLPTASRYDAAYGYDQPYDGASMSGGNDNWAGSSMGSASGRGRSRGKGRSSAAVGRGGYSSRGSYGYNSNNYDSDRYGYGGNQGNYARGRGRGRRGRGRGRGGGRWNSRNSRDYEYDAAPSVYSTEPSKPAYHMTLKSERQRQEQMDPELDFDVEAGGQQQGGYGYQHGYEYGEDGTPGQHQPSGASAASSNTTGVPSFSSAPTHPVSSPSLPSQRLPITNLPPEFTPLFPYSSFNPVQSQCFHHAFHGDDNLVIAAPTGSGKTVVLEFALCRFFHDEMMEVARKRTREEAERRKQQHAEGKQEGKEAEEGTQEGVDEEEKRMDEEIDMTKEPAQEEASTNYQGKKWFQHKKAIYICPLKALCDERARDWVKFELMYGLRLVQVTGDQEVPYGRVNAAHIIITTPEKWDALSRRLEVVDRRLMLSVGLMMVDEVHLLNDPMRGGVLEGLISRSKMRMEEVIRDNADPTRREPIGSLRILALSATAPNARDVADWLGGQAFSFGDETRQVPCEYFVYAYRGSGNPWAFEGQLSKKLFELIRRHGNGQPTLVFCSTRKGAEKAAKAILDDIETINLKNIFVTNEIQAQVLRNAIDEHQFPDYLARLIRRGISFHHAGMSAEERSTIEELFRKQHLQVICSTATLGQGVNFPAHCVILRGTEHWVNGKMEEMDASTVMQFIGRAGRPQYDKTGVAVIMCDMTKQDQYRSVITGRDIESHLNKRMIEHLNAEICVGQLRKPHACIHWLKSTFMFTRMCKNPYYYFHGPRNPKQIEQELQNLGMKMLHSLEQAGMLQYMDAGRVQFRATRMAHIVARWYLSFSTALMLSQIPDDMTFEGYLDLFSRSDDVTPFEAKLRPGDKGALNPFLHRRKRSKKMQAIAADVADAASMEGESAMAMTMSARMQQEMEAYDTAMPGEIELPFPPAGGRVNSPVDKAKVLVQIDCVGRETDSLNFNLKQDLANVMGPGVRVARAIGDYMVNKAVEVMLERTKPTTQFNFTPEMKVGYMAVRNAIMFRKCIVNKCFPNTPGIFAQLPHIGPKTARALFGHVADFNGLLHVSEHQVRVGGIHHLPTNLDTIKRNIHALPNFRVTIEQMGYLTDTQCARVMFTFERHSSWRPSAQFAQSMVYVLIGGHRNELIHFHQLHAAQLPYSLKLDIGNCTHVRAEVIDENIVGCDASQVMFLRYGSDAEGMIPSELDDRISMVGEVFKQMDERRSTVEKAASGSVAAAADSSSLEQEASLIAQSRQKEADERFAAAEAEEQSYSSVKKKKKEFCKHKAPACQNGRCKHVCCKERYENRPFKTVQSGDLMVSRRDLERAQTLVFDDDNDDFLPRVHSSATMPTQPLTNQHAPAQTPLPTATAPTPVSTANQLPRKEMKRKHSINQILLDQLDEDRMNEQATLPTTEDMAAAARATIINNKRIRLQAPTQSNVSGNAEFMADPVAYLDSITQRQQQAEQYVTGETVQMQGQGGIEPYGQRGMGVQQVPAASFPFGSNQGMQQSAPVLTHLQPSQFSSQPSYPSSSVMLHPSMQAPMPWSTPAPTSVSASSSVPQRTLSESTGSGSGSGSGSGQTQSRNANNVWADWREDEEDEDEKQQRRKREELKKRRLETMVKQRQQQQQQQQHQHQ